MARITKDGRLSGSLGDLVFVNSTSHPYVRTKPSDLQQTDKTKAAAQAFGFASAKDKLFRQALMRQLALITDSRYAARHRARMSKALGTETGTHSEYTDGIPGLPESLIRFDFNALCPWEKTTRFYPEFIQPDPRELECRLPALKAGREIILPKDARGAELRLDAFTVNPLGKTIPLHLLSSHTAEVSATEAALPAVWKFAVPQEAAWLFVTGTVLLKGAMPHQTAAAHGSSTYLFAKRLDCNGCEQE